jgi:hypothetical protein
LKRLRVLFKAAVTTMFDGDIKVFINMGKSWVSTQAAQRAQSRGMLLHQLFKQLMLPNVTP